MLSRTAENLYWLARYVERAENIARMLDVSLGMSNVPFDSGTEGSEWHSTIVSAGCEETFYKKYQRPSADAVIHHLVRDAENPSSIMSCLATARRNSRAVRTALTVDMWEAINGTWLEARSLGDDAFKADRIRRLLEWVKERSLLYSGAATSTMLQTDAYWFTRLGTFVERADNTARILDVKYNVLLPRHESVGGTLDYYHWAAILRSVSAHRAYHWVYRDRLKPWLVAELLILRPEMPRSLITCVRQMNYFLDVLANAYSARGECHEFAAQFQTGLAGSSIEQIFQDGLHEFLTRFIDQNVELGQKISRHYLRPD